MRSEPLKALFDADLAATANWRSLSGDERMAYVSAFPDSRFAVVADSSGRSWWDSLSKPQKKEYLEEHPKSKFAQHLTTLKDDVQQKFGKLSDNSRKAVSDWHDASPAERIKSVAAGVAHIGKRAGHHAVHHAKHEYDMYKNAGIAVGHLMGGKTWSALEPHHKKSLRNALIHTGITAGSMAMGDPTGEGAHHAISALLGEFAQEHAHHAAILGAGHVFGKTSGDVLKKATAADRPVDPRIVRMAQRVSRALLAANIPTKDWIEILSEIERQQQLKTASK